MGLLDFSEANTKCKLTEINVRSLCEAARSNLAMMKVTTECDISDQLGTIH